MVAPKIPYKYPSGFNLLKWFIKNDSMIKSRLYRILQVEGQWEKGAGGWKELIDDS
jgi:hypothetical protein